LAAGCAIHAPPLWFAAARGADGDSANDLAWLLPAGLGFGCGLLDVDGSPRQTFRPVCGSAVAADRLETT